MIFKNPMIRSVPMLYIRKLDSSLGQVEPVFAMVVCKMYFH